LILIDATPLQSEHRHRGVGTYTRCLAETLLTLSPDDVTFVATNRDVELLPPVMRGHAVTGRRGHRPAQVYWVYNEWFLRRVIWRTRPAVFHATDFNGLVTTSGVRTVATLHDCTALREGFHHAGLSGRLTDMRWRVYYFHKLPRADHIIAVSEYVKADAVTLLGVPHERITVIPHGVDLEHFRPMKGEGSYAHEPPYFLFIGGRAPNKNLDRILAAFAPISREFPTLHLYLAGAWQSEDVAWLERTCSQLGVTDRVRHVGFVSQIELPGLYANALSFLLPSLEEGFGLPVLEAMACGTPVLTSDRSALPEVAGSAALLVEPTDTSGITAVLRELTRHPRLRTQLAQAGLKRVQEFRWTEVARRTLDVYRQVATASPSGQSSSAPEEVQRDH
jgi:glycosyltransferase involved in cell wall biosynthesis